MFGKENEQAILFHSDGSFIESQHNTEQKNDTNLFILQNVYKYKLYKKAEKI